IKHLYETKLKDQLKGLESLRKKARTEAIFAAIFGAPAVILLWLFDGDIQWLSVPPGGGALYYFYRYNKAWKIFRTSYKERVVRKIIEVTNPDWVYHPDERITREVYHKSEIFRTGVDRYNGDDLLSGMIGETDFACSELHTEYKTTTTDSKGRTKTTYHTIFKGLFFHADFHKHFHGKTFVLPDRSEKMFGNFGKAFQKLSTRGELVTLEDPKFEEEFAVYATDQQEARYILTPTMMEAMCRLKELHGKTFYFSFIDTRVYCAISISEKLFEPPLFKSGVNYENVRKIYELIKINESIVAELNLNTRIWTKT
ncbi:MAG: DUF3137 domain-containing protein, partial [Bacteroidota bacterium]